jgi:hypothetical protein
LCCILLTFLASASNKRARLDTREAHKFEDIGNVDSSDTGSTGDAVSGKLGVDPASSPSMDEELVEEALKHAAAAAAARTALVLAEDLQFESGFVSFPEKLMSLLDGFEVQESMGWLPHGDAFYILPAIFDAVLEKHFQGTKFESFTRKLNRW